MPTINDKLIPDYVTHVTKTIEKAGFEVFLVGGCVRDLIMSQMLSDNEVKREPKDWDLTTNAKPEEIIALFKKTVYENTYGTVMVGVEKKEETPPAVGHLPLAGEEKSVTRETENNAANDVIHETPDNQIKVKYDFVEVTPYRIEAKYSDFRHPDAVRFSDNIEDDLKRRDFTVNAMAYNPSKGQLIDLYKGQEDIKDRVVRAVGNSDDRFTEDALRMLRAIRFSTQLDFAISYDTMESISKNAPLIKNISFERIHDEFTKIITSDNPVSGIALLQKLGLLKFIIPELEEGIGCIQGGEHIYDVWEHLLHALDHASKKGWSLEVRLAALFHDIGKPRSRRAGEKKAYTFYGHEVIGERLTKEIMNRLKYPKKTTELVVKLVRNHMFFSDPEKISLSAVRRIVANVGTEHIWELMQVRECDRVGMKKKEAPVRLRKYHALIEEVLRSPISVSQLAIDGKYLINELGVKAGPRMGWILSALLEEVLDDPKKNTKEHLGELVASLDMLGDPELKTLGERGREKKDYLEKEEITKLHKKHGV